MVRTRNLILLLFSSLFCVTWARKLVPGNAFDRLITIWLENQDYGKVIKDRDFAKLKKQGILLTNFYAQTHPSQPNYIAALAGDYFGMDHDDFVRIPANISTLIDLLDTRNITWHAYQEGIPGPGYLAAASDGTGNGTWDYVRKHNPFVSFDSITNLGRRLWNIEDFVAFKHAMDIKRVPQFAFVTPNMLNNGHNTTLEYATDWSRKFIEPLLKKDAFEERTLIMLTYDESENYDEPNKIGTLLLGSAIPSQLKGTTDKTFYTHYSMLSTVQYNWDLPNLGRYDVGANVFDFAVNQRQGWKNKEPANAKNVDNSISYAGALHSDPSKRLPYPAPNLYLTGASGKGVLNQVKLQYTAKTGGGTPYDGTGAPVDGGNNIPTYNSQGPNRMTAVIGI